MHTYGPEKYLRHAVASVQSIRRHDRRRPVALYCSEEQQARLKETGLDALFEVLEVLPEAHRSIVGFKHHLEKFKPFARSLFVDVDMIWCRNPDPLWQQLAAFPFTATGIERSDVFFGGPKGLGFLVDWLFDRRRKTMRHFGLSYLPRIQAGMIYAQDDAVTARMCERSREFLSRRRETHFRSRLDEGRSEESCEWSMAMAASSLDLPVFPWFQGQNSPQLDYVEGFVEHDASFRRVRVRYYNDAFVRNLRGIPSRRLRDTLIGLAARLPGKGDWMWATPYVLHFGWMHHKQPFFHLADAVWDALLQGDSSDGSRSIYPPLAELTS
jgi:hypothetical protein